MRSSHALPWTLGLSLALFGGGCHQTYGRPIVEGAPPDPIEAALNDMRDGRRPLADLEVVYDDMHGLYGGETITVRGDGTIEVVRRDPPQEATTSTAPVTSDQLQGIVELLLDIAAWWQEVPERTMLPDESRARLAVRCTGAESSIWEFYNELEGLDRIVRVRDYVEGLLPAAR